MSEPSAFGFGQFVPGFDFLQNLSKTASAAQPTAAASMPGMASWVAPTLSIEDIDKRIQELKSVQFWLDQNAKALSATIQALEVQRMTLETLQGMNLGMADVAASMTGKAKAAQPVVDPMQWWGAVGQQFQSIAVKTMQEMQQNSATTASAKPASTKTAAAKPRPAAKKSAPAKARKPAPRASKS